MTIYAHYLLVGSYSAIERFLQGGDDSDINLRNRQKVLETADRFFNLQEFKLVKCVLCKVAVILT